MGRCAARLRPAVDRQMARVARATKLVARGIRGNGNGNGNSTVQRQVRSGNLSKVAYCWSGQVPRAVTFRADVADRQALDWGKIVD